MGPWGNRLVRVSGTPGRYTGVQAQFRDNVGTIRVGTGLTGSGRTEAEGQEMQTVPGGDSVLGSHPLHQIIHYLKDKIGVVYFRCCVIFDTL